MYSLQQIEPFRNMNMKNKIFFVSFPFQFHFLSRHTFSSGIFIIITVYQRQTIKILLFVVLFAGENNRIIITVSSEFSSKNKAKRRKMWKRETNTD